MDTILKAASALYHLCHEVGIDPDHVEIRLPYGDYRELERHAIAACPPLIETGKVFHSSEFRLHGILFKPTEIPRAYIPRMKVD